MAVHNDYQSFLGAYFRQLHLSKIDAGRRQTLEDLRGRDMGAGASTRYPDDKRNKEQKTWAPDDPLPDMTATIPATPATATAPATPAMRVLEDADAKALYRDVREILRKMEDDESDIKSEFPDLPKEWKPFFDNPLAVPPTTSSFDKFKPYPAIRDTTLPPNPALWAPGAGGHLDHFYRLFASIIITPADEPVAVFVRRIRVGSYDMKAFMDDYKLGNYSAEFIGFIEEVKNRVSYQYTGNKAYFNMSSGAIDPNLAIFAGRRIDKIIDGVNRKKEPVDATRLATFSRFSTPPAPPAVGSHQKLLDLIYSNENFRNVFSAHGGDKIVNLFTHAKASADYEKLPPTLTDKKGILEAAKDNIEEWGDEHLSKVFGSKHESHKYTKLEAKSFIEAIRKLKIKPQDGLAGIVAKAGEIKTELESGEKRAPGHTGVWKTFTTIMGEAQTGMKSAFKGALKNAPKMLAVVQYAIYRAVHMGKKEDGKAILETLYISQYDNLTSDRWEEFDKNHYDSGLTKSTGLGLDKGAGKWMIKAAEFVVERGIADPLFLAAHGLNRFVQTRGGKVGNATMNFKKYGALAKPMEDEWKRTAAEAVRLGHVAAPGPTTLKPGSYGIPISQEYQDITELLAFWDYLHTGEVRDKTPFIARTKMQQDFTDANRFAGGTAAHPTTIIADWRRSHGYAA